MKIAIGVDEKVYPAVKIAMVLDALAAEGLPAEEAIRGLGLTLAEMSSPATRVSLNQVLKACCAAGKLSRDPHFAYHAGLRLHVSAYGMYGFAILSSMNYRRTMKFVMDYYQLAAPLVDLEFSEAGGSGIWAFTPIEAADDDALVTKFIVEMQFGIMTSLFRDVMGAAFAPREFHVVFEPPHDAAEYPKLLGRTLRRKLSDENTSFRQVADELRMEMAIRYLRDTELTVEDIAELLGFSDAANFRHAFRRWTNAAPNAFRGNRGA